MLGCGDLTAYLYTRGGRFRLGKFDGVIEGRWERAKNDISSALVTVSVEKCGCDFLGDIRSMHHELVLYRDDLRVWEGPITRVEYTPTTVTVNAKDVLFYLARRVNRGRFHTGNVVDEAAALVSAALTYDDANIQHFVTSSTRRSSDVFTCAWNRGENYYFDALQDMVDAGLAFTALGRRIILWPSSKQIGQTPLLRSAQDLQADVTVIEDGVSLATRVVVAGNDTFGAANRKQVVLEPTVINYSTNPSLEINTAGYTGKQVISKDAPNVISGFDLTRVSATWGAGKFAGQVMAHPPQKPGKMRARPKAPHLGKKGSDSAATWDARKDKYHEAKDAYENDLKNWEAERKVASKASSQYNAALSDYTQTEIVMDMGGQRISVSEGELISAILYVRPIGSTKARLGIRFKGDFATDEEDDRSFEEGPPITLKANTTSLLFVQGTVPKGTKIAYAEVYRDTKIKWDSAALGFQFDKFAFFRGRKEAWFDGSTTDTADHTFTWDGAVNSSRSRHMWANDFGGSYPQPTDAAEYRDRMDPYGSALEPAYYGIIETLEDTQSQNREAMEKEALAKAKKAYPAPLLVDVPQDSPLAATAPVTIEELVAGTTVPVQTTATCRGARADTSLTNLKVIYDEEGEKVTITLTGGQVWEADPDDDGTISASDINLGILATDDPYRAGASLSPDLQPTRSLEEDEHGV